MNKIKITYLSLFILVLINSSCKTRQFFSSHKAKIEKSNEIYKITVSNYLNYKTFSAKMNVKLNLPKQKNSFGASIRIQKDSVIWISITPALGIEMFRVSITQDSIKFINKMNTTYFAGDYKYIETSMNLNLNYNIIQSILLNEFFKYENDININKNINEFYSSIDSNVFSLQNISNKELKKIDKQSLNTNYLFQQFLINTENYKIISSKVDEKILNRNLIVEYTDIKEIDNYLFPYKINIEIKNNNEDAGFFIKYNRITLNKKLKFPFKISSKYTKLN